jgi:hypothetical protein
MHVIWIICLMFLIAGLATMQAGRRGAELGLPPWLSRVVLATGGLVTLVGGLGLLYSTGMTIYGLF